MALTEAIDCARRQQAVALEMRAGLVLAPIMWVSGRTAEARGLLEELIADIQDQREYPEVREAHRLLERL